jgi:hypothetical protein
MIFLKRVWILPATYLLIYKMRVNERYPNAFMIAMSVLVILMLTYDFYKDRKRGDHGD